MVWVLISASVELNYLCCHGFNNNSCKIQGYGQGYETVIVKSQPEPTRYMDTTATANNNHLTINICIEISCFIRQPTGLICLMQITNTSILRV